MKILVFSDTHLSLPYEPKKYSFLEKIIREADRVIINGDFWEGYTISFDDFINSPWKKLFPLLKTKKTIYLFGNHDKARLSDHRTSLFSDFQTNVYRLEIGGKRFVFEHGNRIYPFFDEWARPVRIPEPIGSILERGRDFLTRRFGNTFILFAYKEIGRRMRQKVKESYSQSEIVVVGHTHFRDIDEKNGFINPGFIDHGLAQYITIEDGRVRIHEEWYDR